MQGENWIAGGGILLLSIVLVLGVPVLLVPLSIALLIWLVRLAAAAIHPGR
jgi:hypothetical protein